MITYPFTARRLPAKLAGLALLASVSPLAIAPALADSDPAPAPTTPVVTQSVGTSSPNDIVVTATKRAVSLQKVPQSIIAVGGETLKQHMVSSFDDYAKMLPSVSYQSFGPGQSQLNFRGITTGGDGDAAGPLPTAGMYIDETPVTSIANGVDLHIYDMARVEALSGPQGTLYGASSLSGTLRLITNKPVIGKWEGGIDVDGNKFGPGNGGGKVEGYLNIPLGTHMALRVVGYYQHDGGYISNTYGSRTYNRTSQTGTDGDGNAVYSDSPMTVNNGAYVKKNFNSVDYAGGRAALKIDLDDNWTVTPGVIYQHMKSNGTFLQDPNAGDLSVHDYTKEYNRDNWVLASLTIQGKLSDWDVTYSGSYFDRKVDSVADYSYFTVAYDNLAKSDPADYAGYTHLTDSAGNAIDPTQLVHLHDHYMKTSHELRISSPADKPLRLTAGFFMQRQVTKHTGDYYINGLTNAVDAESPSIPGATNADDVFDISLRRVDRDYAMYAEGEWDITPKLTLIAGIRGFITNNSMLGFSGTYAALQTSAATNNCATVTVGACPNVSGDAQESGETHRATLKWQATPTKQVYFTYSTGFRPGGTNPVLVNAAGNVYSVGNFKSDTLTNYEFGFKTSWLNHKVYVNGALFWEDWNNFQMGQVGPLGIYYTVNPGNARSRGAEAQISWQPIRKLSLSANGAYTDAKLTTNYACTVANSLGGCDGSGTDYGTIYAAKGTRLPITPRWKINGTARYETKLGAYDAFLQGGFTYQSGTTSELITADEEAVGGTSGFTTVDFSAGLSKDRWTLSAYITNAFDSRGVLSKNLSCVPGLCGQYSREYITKPQQFGLTAGYHF